MWGAVAKVMSCTSLRRDRRQALNKIDASAERWELAGMNQFVDILPRFSDMACEFSLRDQYTFCLL